MLSLLNVSAIKMINTQYQCSGLLVQSRLLLSLLLQIHEHVRP